MTIQYSSTLYIFLLAAKAFFGSSSESVRVMCAKSIGGDHLISDATLPRSLSRDTTTRVTALKLIRFVSSRVGTRFPLTEISGGKKITQAMNKAYKLLAVYLLPDSLPAVSIFP